MWIAICKHCHSPAFTYKRQRKPATGERIPSDLLCWADGEPAVRSQDLFGSDIAMSPRCMACGRVNSQPGRLKWVKPRDIYCGSESAVRNRYKVLLRACMRIIAFINRIAADERLPEDVREPAKDLNRIIFMLRENVSLKNVDKQEAVST
jgi:hypothetical protein